MATATAEEDRPGPDAAEEQDQRKQRRYYGSLAVLAILAAGVGNALSLRRQLIRINSTHHVEDDAFQQAFRQHQRASSSRGSWRTGTAEHAKERARRVAEQQARVQEERARKERILKMWMREESDKARWHAGYTQFEPFGWQKQQAHTHRERVSTDSPFPPKDRTLGNLEHYKALGLDHARADLLSQDDIKSAFRARVKECHPDLHPEKKDEAAAKFRKVVKAYQALQTA
eukprot:jgi/Chlat1/7780/Chrsp66S07238